MTFEEALTELETVVQDLDRGDITLDAALSRYERGIALLKECFGQLKHAEAKVRMLTGVDDQGQPTLADFDDEAEDGGRTKRRPKKS